MIPCSAGKLDEPTRAVELYTGSMFRHTLAAAQAAVQRGGGEVLILSAKHGLVAPAELLEPYNVKMGDPGCVSVRWVRFQALVYLGVEPATVYTLLPRAYLAVLAEALKGFGVRLVDLYAGTRGIGDQRAVNTRLARNVLTRFTE